ncbi:MAG: IS1634 family transposase, partial [Albidovulum sp.]|nr:IS1634 family transposase [Albidovulum sp.]
VERAFRTMKASRLEVRPVYVYSENRVRAHVFMCMLACHVEWHMRRKLAPMLFEDDDPEGARAKRATPIEKAEVSDRARDKARSKKTDDGLPAHSFDTLLADLGTPARNEAAMPASPEHAFTVLAQPTPLQEKAFRLLEIDPAK